MSKALTPLPLTVGESKVDDCWNRIGVQGDHSCPELVKYIHCRNCPVFASAGQALYDREPPDGYTAEWTQAIAQAEVQEAARTIPVVVFQVADEWLALDVAYTVEVAPVRTIRRVPHHGDALLLGVVNIRGELQLAVSLRYLLGVGDGKAGALDPDRARMLVAEKNGVRWVFVVDEVHDIHHFREEDLSDVPATLGAGGEVFTRGVFRWEGKSVGYLDPYRLFNALRRSFR